MKLRFAVTVVAFALSIGGAAQQRVAQADSLGVIEGEILDVSAERLDVDVQRGQALLEGDVKATLGELVLRCPRVEIVYDESPRVERAKATGGVSVRLKGIEATAQSLEVDVPKRSVALSGNVRVARGRGWVTAERATLDMATGKVTLHAVKGEIPVEPPAR